MLGPCNQGSDPAGYVGTSGVKIFDPNIINQRAPVGAAEAAAGCSAL